jgi:hypothetical protein
VRPHLGCARPVPRSIAGSGARSIHARPIGHGHSFGRDPRDQPAPFTSPRGPHPAKEGNPNHPIFIPFKPPLGPETVHRLTFTHPPFAQHVADSKYGRPAKKFAMDGN